MRPGFSICSPDTLNPISARRLPASSGALRRKSRSYCPDSWSTRRNRAEAAGPPSSVHRLPEGLADLEGYRVRRADGDALAGARVPVLASRPALPGKRAEAHDSDGITARERLADDRKHRADHNVDSPVRSPTRRLRGRAASSVDRALRPAAGSARVQPVTCNELPGENVVPARSDLGRRAAGNSLHPSNRDSCAMLDSASISLTRAVREARRESSPSQAGPPWRC